MGVVGQILLQQEPIKFDRLLTTDIFWALPVWNGMRVIYLWISDSLFTDVFLFSSLSKIRVPLRSLNKSPAFFCFIRAFYKL